MRSDSSSARASNRTVWRKHRFTIEERWGVWVAHDRQCRLDKHLVAFADFQIDHFFPEWLENDPEELALVIERFGLPRDFEVNSFANWVPACSLHNNSKRGDVPEWTSEQQRLARDNLRRASAASAAALRVKSELPGSKVLAQILVALQKRTMTLRDLVDLVDDLLYEPSRRHMPPGSIFLGDEGRFVAEEEIVKACQCQCERQICVGRNTKVWCIFTTDQSTWVVETGLFKNCYDEIVECPRCGATHRRGDVGRQRSCGAPFANQELHTD